MKIGKKSEGRNDTLRNNDANYFHSVGKRSRITNSCLFNSNETIFETRN